MEVRTIDYDFEYQMKRALKEMQDAYKEDQDERREGNIRLQPFSEWLWEHTDELGKEMYNRLDLWCGVEEFTEEFNEK